MIRTVFENEPFDASVELAGYLSRALGGNFQVRSDGARIVRMAGTLSLPDGTVLSVQSRKAPFATLIAWAAYASPDLRALRHVRVIPELGGAGDLSAVLARTFCEELQRAVNVSGLLRQYQRERVVSPTVRGRIDFARLARLGGSLSKVPCTVFSRLPSTPLNRILTAALERVLARPVMRTAAGPHLGALHAAFVGVRPGGDLEHDVAHLQLSRRELPFSTSLALARLILGAHGMSEGVETGVVSFVLNLANLFEAAVARAFVESARDVAVKKPLAYMRAAGADWTYGGSMEIDVLLRTGDEGRPVVVDAKYKTSPDSANRQQMVTYCWMTGARQAVLVFPSGCLTDRRPFRYAERDGGSVTIHLVEFDTSAASLRGWASAGATLVEDVLSAVRGPQSHDSQATAPPL